MAHSVEGHLKLKIDEYDRRIRTLVYGYDAMRVIHMDLLARCLPRAGGLVLDLGGGTGALAAAVAERFPNVRVQIWDTDTAMLAFARERCAPFNDRISFVARSFAEPLPACDAVVACIALHHVKDLTAKGEIYRHIFAALRPGGLFANADTMMDSRPGPREHYFNVWSRFQQTHGTTDAEARQNFADWAVEDYYPPLWLELKLLAAAGFAEPECFWRQEHQAVFGGIK
ncbi:MAG TPA: class I SAM-dependent methyltransferase [Lacunisphaera sp.]|nr:class I SAM-dependent methyltransferase [Lacunisphaera sp.]